MNEQMLKQYKKTVEFLGNVLGPDYEIILHDLSPGKNSIAAIKNGHISGRTLGAPLTDFALKKIAEKAYETSDYSLNYVGRASDGRALRSSTMYIKDDRDKLVGILCINFDGSKFDSLASSVSMLMNVYAGINTPEAAAELKSSTQDTIENFAQSITDVVSTSLDNELLNSNIPIDRLTKEEKLQIVEALNNKGVFLLKGAVNEVAKRLFCSEASIYRYLSKISKNG